MKLLTFVEMACCFSMTSLIWLVQLVHYPSFRYVDEQKFIPFARFHSARISLIVTPLMFMEIAASAMLFYLHKNVWSGISFGTVGLIWLATFFLSVPNHQKLLRVGYNAEAIERLIKTNWIRTLLWSLRTAAFLYIFHHG